MTTSCCATAPFDMKNGALPLSNGVFFSVPRRRPHHAASVDKVSEVHMRREDGALPAAASTRPTTRTRRRQCASSCTPPQRSIIPHRLARRTSATFGGEGCVYNHSTDSTVTERSVTSLHASIALHDRGIRPPRAILCPR